MAIARKHLIDPSRPGWVHCISRCVRQAYLCGGAFEHRKQWVEDRLQFLTTCFAVDVAAFAVMANHLHVIVRMRVEDLGAMSAEEVARRWQSIYPRKYLSDGTPTQPSDALIQAQAADWAWVAEKRKRLADLGWFMKALKESISKRANREDNCTGAFWEGRFVSVPLLDQPALIACMAYVDLNPIRAKVCDRPERSQATSVFRRVKARQRSRAESRLRERALEQAIRPTTRAGLSGTAAHAVDGHWLTPLERCTVGEVLANKRLTVEEYLAIVDATGRIIKANKRGAIPVGLAPILDRLELSTDQWMETMLGHRQMCGSGIGSAESRAREAVRRGVRWLKNRCPLFRLDGIGDAA